MHLRCAGKLTQVRGMIFGEMTDCVQHVDQGYTILDVINACTADLEIPILFGVRSGHSELGNLVLPLGVEVTLDCSGPSATLSLNESAVT